MTVWEGKHPLHFFSLQTQHHFQTSQSEGLSQELWGHGVSVPLAGPSAKRGAKATQEGPAAPQVFCRFKSAIMTLFASGILRKMKQQLLCQPATNRATFSLLAESQLMLIWQHWLRAQTPLQQQPRKALCWLHSGDKQHCSNTAEQQGQRRFTGLLCSPGNLR